MPGEVGSGGQGVATKERWCERDLVLQWLSERLRTRGGEERWGEANTCWLYREGDDETKHESVCLSGDGTRQQQQQQ